MRLSAMRGDITTLKTDAIVNAANDRLLPGGGVCGAIHAVAGPKLAEECDRLGGCPTGEARLTRGYGLPAGHVIHAVAPIWQGGSRGEAGLLAACYRAIARIVRQKRFRTIAIPAIGTGIYGYPIEAATHIAVTTMAAETSDLPGEATFVCFRDSDLAIYQTELQSLRT